MCKIMKNVVIHLVSDYSGQTVKYVAKSALSQFNNIKSKEYHWPLVKNKDLLNEVLNKIEKKPGIVLYTINNSLISSELKKFCYKLKIPCISVISEIVNSISDFLGIVVNEGFCRRNFDENYFSKVSAIDFTLRHDDGNMVDDLEDADIILLGPSRTSKTPTSVFLAYNGFKTANIPYINGYPFPETLGTLSNQLLVGLVINPYRLVEIRETRMNLINVKEHSGYTDINIIQDECLYVKRFCNKMGWPFIDVSRKSIEETSAIIMKLYYSNK